LPADCSLGMGADSQTPACTKEYIVQPGDICSTDVWQRFGLTEQELLALNPGLNCSALHPRQQLCVASSLLERSPCLKQQAYIPTNATCASIAAEARLTIPNLHRLNPNLDCRNLSMRTDKQRPVGWVCVQNRLLNPSAPELHCLRWLSVDSDASCSDVVDAAAEPGAMELQ
jgi:hypothetical protein